MSAKGNKSPSVKSDDGASKEKPTPFYMLGKDGEQKPSAKGKDARTPHQKKKDSKEKDIIRKSNKTEEEWLAKWKKAHPQNNNKDNKEDEKKNDDNKNNKEIEVDYDPMTLDICLKMLLTLVM